MPSYVASLRHANDVVLDHSHSSFRGGDGSAKVGVLINIHKDRSRKKVGAVYEQTVFVVDVRLYTIML